MRAITGWNAGPIATRDLDLALRRMPRAGRYPRFEDGS
jgi:hypothetical protein